MTMKKRILLKIAYDGTNYCGFQVQPNGITVQEVVNRAVSDLTGEKIRTIGASRTDAGVHALGNVAVFDTESRMDGSKYSFALNTRLPEDIRIVGSREVPADFHPRYTDTIKTYEYHIWNSRFPDPTKRLYSLFCYYYLDLDIMRGALKAVEGTHDFRSFQSSAETNPDKDTVRTIYRAELICGSGEEQGKSPESSGETDGYHGLMTIRLCGNGFLYNMVRIIAGTLIEIGRGKLPPDAMPGIIASRQREAAGPTAPAHGLTLINIDYPAYQ